MAHRMNSQKLAVLGTGIAMPGAPVSNADLVRFFERSTSRQLSAFVGSLADELGVLRRHLCRDLLSNFEVPRPGDTNPELSARAVTSALADADLRIDDIDVLIGHTTSPHTLLPPNTSWTADQLGFTGQYMELRQACTGFANALTIAASMLQSGAADRICIVGSETGSVFYDVQEALRDRSQLVTAAQMGDGAGAVILSRHADAPTVGCIDHIYFGHLGLNKPTAFSLVTGGSSQPYVAETPGPRGFYNAYSLARDSGLELFQRGFDALASVGLNGDTVRRFLPHQANGRMGMVLSPLLSIDENRFHNHAVKYGNTGSASTWIGLHSVRVEQLLQPGEVLGVLGAEATKFMFGGFAYFEGQREAAHLDGDGCMSVPRPAVLPPSRPRGPTCN